METTDHVSTVVVKQSIASKYWQGLKTIRLKESIKAPECERNWRTDKRKHTEHTTRSMLINNQG